jgi:hypothetical protein
MPEKFQEAWQQRAWYLLPAIEVAGETLTCTKELLTFTAVLFPVTFTHESM